MKLAVVTALTLISLSTSSFEGVNSYSVHLRIAASLTLVAAMIFVSPAAAKASPHRRSVLLGVVGVAVGNTIYTAAATLPHGLSDEFLSRSSATALTLLVLYVVVTYFNASVLLAGVLAAFQVMLFLSVLAVFAIPATAYEEGRARGIFENANLLGFVSALAIAIAIISRTHHRGLLLTSVMALPLLVSSGSRASLLLLLVSLLGLAIAGNARARRIVVAGSLAGAVIAFFYIDKIRELVILRAEFSRLDAVQVVRYAWSIDPWYGLGALSLERESGGFAVAGALPSAVIQGGSVGLVGLLVMWMFLLRGAQKVSKEVLAFTLALIAHSVFESSFLALSGAMFLLLMLGWTAVSINQTPLTRSSPPVPGLVRKGAVPGVAMPRSSRPGRR